MIWSMKIVNKINLLTNLSITTRKLIDVKQYFNILEWHSESKERFKSAAQKMSTHLRHITALTLLMKNSWVGHKLKLIDTNLGLKKNLRWEVRHNSKCLDCIPFQNKNECSISTVKSPSSLICTTLNRHFIYLITNILLLIIFVGVNLNFSCKYTIYLSVNDSESDYFDIKKEDITHTRQNHKYYYSFLSNRLSSN